MLKPQEIYILVALASRDDQDWTYDRLASELEMPPSQVFKSLERAEFSGLWVKERRRVVRRNLLEFLIHGLRYAFPAQVGRVVRGVPASWRAPGLTEFMVGAEETFVWPSASGTARGQSISPLHSSLPVVALAHPELHARFALVDILRVGSARERKVAAAELEVRLG